MATSIIKGGVIEFTGSRASAMDSGACYGIYDQKSGIVTINFNAISSANITTLDTIFTIPAAYRPSENKAGMAFVITSNGETVGGTRVTADGEIKQLASSIGRRVAGSITYKI